MAEKRPQEAATMPDSKHKQEWDKQYTLVVTFKLFREYNGDRNDQDIIEWLNSTPGKRSEKIKAALREYMTSHPKAPQSEENTPTDETT